MVVSSEWYEALFPTLRWEKETGLEFITTQGGADTRPQLQERSLGVIDWYGGALVSRLNDKQTARSLRSCSACHEDDLAGHLVRQGGWDHLDMPAIALEDEIIELGSATPDRNGLSIRRRSQSRPVPPVSASLGL